MTDPTPTPARHTPDGGVRLGSSTARRELIVFEDLQCPYCRQFEQACADLLAREVAAGAVGVEYRIRSFLGPESARAANALALAAEADRFDSLRRELFAAQPPEGSGGFTAEDLIAAGRRAGVPGPDYEAGVRQERYADWAAATEQRFADQDPEGTPAALLDGRPVEQTVLYDADALGALLRG